MGHMLREIREQPAALARTLGSGRRSLPALLRSLGRRPPKFVVLAARGSSDNAAHFGKYIIETTTGIPVALAAPSVTTLYRSTLRLDDALVVGVSQSGESTDVNEVVEVAAQSGARTVGITNEAKSSLASLAGHVLHVRAGKERSVAATKTYTGQVMMFYLLAQALGGRLAGEDLDRLPALASAALALEGPVRERVERYRFMERAVVVGRGFNYGNAFEFALKLMETCYVVAERFSSADLMHGPIAMLEKAFPVFLFAPSGPAWPGLRDLLVKLDALGTETLVIADRSNERAVARRASLVIPERIEEVYSPIPYIVPAQLFAAHLAELKGVDPDHPRTLHKVTRTK